MHVRNAVVNYPHKLELALVQYKKIVSFGTEKQFTLHCVYPPVLVNSKQSWTIEAYVSPPPCRWTCRGLEWIFYEMASAHEKKKKTGMEFSNTLLLTSHSMLPIPSPP